MDKVKYYWPVFLQVLQIPLVIAIFANIPNRQYAGLVAATMFISVSIFLMNYFYRRLDYRSWAMYMLMLHLFLFSIPILSIRLAYWGVPFEEIEFVGLRAQSLHKFSEKAYVVVLWASLIDCTRILKLDKGAGAKSNSTEEVEQV